MSTSFILRENPPIYFYDTKSLFEGLRKHQDSKFIMYSLVPQKSEIWIKFTCTTDPGNKSILYIETKFPFRGKMRGKFYSIYVANNKFFGKECDENCSFCGGNIIIFSHGLIVNLTVYISYFGKKIYNFPEVTENTSFVWNEIIKKIRAGEITYE